MFLIPALFIGFDQLSMPVLHLTPAQLAQKQEEMSARKLSEFPGRFVCLSGLPG